MLTQKYVNDLAYKVVGCAIEVHKHLGPGLLESVYEACFIDELAQAGISVRAKGLLINFNCENITQQLVPLVTDVFAKLDEE